MNPNIVSALWIGVIGLGLVFLALALLWVIMTVIVNATAKQAQAEAAAEEEAEGERLASNGIEATPIGQLDSNLLRQKAAAVAVAVALSFREKGQVAAQHPALTPQGGLASTWQAVLRANQLNQKSRMYSRKQRGNGK